jgi:hypothetical protein
MAWVVLGLDMRFLGRKWQKKNATAKAKAIDQSFRPWASLQPSAER